MSPADSNSVNPYAVRPLPPPARPPSLSGQQPPIEVQGNIVWSDYRRALRLHHEKWRGLMWPMFAVAAVVGAIWNLLAFDPPWRYFLPTVVPLYLLFWLWEDLRARGQFRRLLSQPFFASLAEDCIEAQQCAVRSQGAWSQYCKFKHDGEVVLLYRTANFFHVFPRRLFRDEQQWHDFVALVGRKLPPA